MRSFVIVALWLFAASVGASSARAGDGTPPGSPAGSAAVPASPDAARPRIGLVLSGGGARGLAHVGVLKVLEREHIKVDLIVGTSMGSIIGGLYASGMSAGEIERELLGVRWDEVFAPRVSRQELSQRRKEQDFEISALLELGWRDGALQAPHGAVSSRGLETLLRRYTLPVRHIDRFEALPIPFRAVATDMETGTAVEMDHGDLALALRSSMSVPGVFAPIEHGGQVLGDGGLVNNLPVDIARRMGADIVIAVNVGTPLAGRDTLGSVLGLTAQMINILTEQNVQRSLALLGPRDLLLAPDLGRLGSGDFEKADLFIEAGEAAAVRAASRLSALTAGAPAHAAWRDSLRTAPPPPVQLAFVAFGGSRATRPERFAEQLESRPGRPFEPAAAERDARRLAASGDYIRADYRIERTPAGEGLLFTLEDKPWGPNLLRAGLDLSTNFSGRSSFNVKLSHERHWLTPNGTEWRNRLNLGESPMVATELYHPLLWSTRFDDDWFVSGWAQAERRRQSVYNLAGDELGLFDRTEWRAGFDIGQPWGELGEGRVGLLHENRHVSPHLLGAGFTGARAATRETETGLRARLVLDQLDYALFPQRGYRAELLLLAGERRSNGGSGTDGFYRLHANLNAVRSFGRHTLNAFMLADLGDKPAAEPLVGRRSLGGFHLMSGYQPGQISGQHLLFGRLSWYMRLNAQPSITRGFFLGASFEAGNAWLRRSQIKLGDLRTSGSLFLGADTGIGPMYLAIVTAPRGETGVMFFIGRP